MKHLIYVILFSLAIVSCEKDTTENTIKPPVVNYPYDSIHKKLIGNWISISDYISFKDTNYYVNIKYDTIFIKRQSSSSYFGSDTMWKVFFLNYRLTNKDTLSGLFNVYHNGKDTLVMHKTAIKFYGTDSLIFNYVLSHNTAMLPLYHPLSVTRIK
jgi:hypothetical protein